MKSSSKELQGLLDNALGEYCFSAYQFVAEGPGSKLSLAGGATSHWPDAVSIHSHTLFDIGSVTKAVVTTSLLARWVDQGGDLDRCPGDWVKSWTASWAKLPLSVFLDHSSGLIPWVAYPGGVPLEDWLGKQGDALVEGPPREQARYSDVNFWILGVVMEKIFGASLKTVFEKEVRSPLALQMQFGPVTEAVATEYHPVRGGLLQGQVFDDNCEAMGGVGGHAGLFSHGEDLGRWAGEWLSAVGGGSRWLSQKVAQRFVKKTESVPSSSWALGWDTKSPQGSTCGTLFSPQSFGHLGFPGASVWIDPKREWSAVLLTNRVHPSRVDNRIRQIRPKVHDLWAKTQGA